jgi:hypothetical protein
MPLSYWLLCFGFVFGITAVTFIMDYREKKAYQKRFSELKKRYDAEHGSI